MSSNLPATFSVQIKSVSKKFGNVWIFKNVSFTLQAGKKYAITGPNGSGKSTLLKIIAGIITPNKGEVVFNLEDIQTQVSFCAPFMDLPDELTLTELLAFHQRLRKLTVSSKEFIETMQLDANKEIRNYSSGMKQRVKLALAFYTEAQLILLDEPTSTLDEHWTNWYLQMIAQVKPGQLLVISSNIREEYSFCDEIIDVAKYLA
ncbi:MAG: transporter ATP-binding protein [Mucilaginibacter sp.]|nr:transporter ATP-binding protein [Mucilaginibacter sp.]